MYNRLLLALFVTLAACGKNSFSDGTRNAETAGQPIFQTASGEQVSKADIEDFVALHMQDLGVPGLSLAILDGGEIVYAGAHGVANLETGEPVTADSVFEAASLSKPVFAYFALKLIDDGLLDLDQPLHEYRPLPELEADGRYHAVTARMVLSHRTGFPNWRWFDPAPEDWKVPRGTMYMKADPGAFTYSGEGYTYLATVIAELTDTNMTTLDSVFQTKVAEPLGLNCAAFIQTACVGARKVKGHFGDEVSDEVWPRSFPDDTPLTFGAAGRLHLNAEDYAVFVKALMDEDGLSPDLFSELYARQTEVPEDASLRQTSGEEAWGLGLAMQQTPYGLRYLHGGNNGEFQSGMMFFRERGLGYVFFANSDQGQAFGERLDAFVQSGQIEHVSDTGE
ncbi:MAG: serine hydrolase domain-containing protein [Pseudomonadota bacterium]